MSDDLVEAGQFLIQFPAWVVGRKDRLQGNRRDFFETDNIDGGRILLLFTDDDLAKTFLEKTGQHEKMALPVRLPSELTAVIGITGATHVAVDPSVPVRNVLFVPMGVVVDACRRADNK